MIDLREFEKKVNVTFKDRNLLKQAFIHRSYINENPRTGLAHNERLEFLGDAVLELIVTDFLYKKYPNKQEGDLTSYRAALVNAQIIGSIAMNDLEMNDFMLLSKGEAKDTGRARLSILADAYEAFLGALYLDQGYDVCDKFVRETILIKTEEVMSKGLWKDPKSLVQEKAQELIGVTPLYKVQQEIGPDHDKRFVVAVYFGAERIAEGEGKSKQEAEQQAAEAALKAKSWVK
jgi:ribonuclease III